MFKEKLICLFIKYKLTYLNESDRKLIITTKGDNTYEN